MNKLFEGIEEADFITGKKSDTSCIKEVNYLEQAKPFSSSKKTDKPFKCEACNGTGTWKKSYHYATGEVKTFQNTCYKCKGSGGFMTSAQDRQKAKIERKKKRRAQENANFDSFASEHKEVCIYILENTCDMARKYDDWNKFMSDLAEKIRKYGELSDKQIAVVEKAIQRKKDWEAKKNQPSANINISVVRDKLLLGKETWKRPVLRAGDTFKFTLAPETGKNSGCVYIKHHGTYIGKIDQKNDFFPYKATKEQMTYLKEFAKDPLKELKAYGSNTGSCGFCGRALTKKESYTVGYGPVCAEKFGLPYGGQ